MRGCEAIAIDLPGYVGGKLDMASSVAVQTHLQSCEACRAEMHEIERLDALLSKALPPIEPSPGFAARFADRLAAEVADERRRQAREERAEDRVSWLAWLMQPWLVPLAAAAMLGAIVFAPRWSDDGAAKSTIPALPSIPSGVAAAKKPADTTAVAAAPASNPKTVASNKEVPKDVIQRPELFVDYAVIRDLDVLEAGDLGAGKAG